jgi:hypothetical protein
MDLMHPIGTFCANTAISQVLSFYSGCQKNVPMAERFFGTTLMPPTFFSECFYEKRYSCQARIGNKKHFKIPDRGEAAGEYANIERSKWTVIY